MKQGIAIRNMLLLALGCCLPYTGVMAGSAADIGYVQDSPGSVVLDSYGNCVRTRTWTEAMRTPDCGGEMTASAVEELTEAAPPAAVQKPALVELNDKGRVLFEFDSAQLTGNADATLGGLMSKINEYQEIDSISITGHTDSTGPDSYNQGLSERRANSIRDYLTAKGVSSDVLSTRGMGEADPVADNSTRDGRAQNRRVVIEVNGKIKQ